ncbi:MAG: transcription antitermination factor NusB [Bacilli bacterium]|nr:transcription antitermination factor NusB [Bacilli bacterium]
MIKNRSELREIAMKCLYQIYILDNTDLDYNTDDIIHEQLEVENEFVKELVYGVVEKRKDIVALANKYLVDWTIDRLNKVDQAILSIGIYELMYTDAPSVVAINEAVVLSKKYSDDAVSKMINGVLDSIYHSEDYHE